MKIDKHLFENSKWCATQVSLLGKYLPIEYIPIEYIPIEVKVMSVSLGIFFCPYIGFQVYIYR